MRVPVSLADGFKEPFQSAIARFAIEKGWIADEAELLNRRFLSRSVAPHITRLGTRFNRRESEVIGTYWKESSNPAHLRMAYFLYYMPSNLFRVAAVWSELARLGYRWPTEASGEPKPLKAIEPGAGPATGACGIAAGERYAPVGLPGAGSWALIEQDKAILELGCEWAADFTAQSGDWRTHDWSFKPFHRKIDLSGASILPPTAPQFNLWVSSYFLNETSVPMEQVADSLVATWKRHLEEDGLVILVEPALKAQSRRLLELRKILIEKTMGGKNPWLKVLLPCLGSQACGALAEAEDWCHEQVTWWRPPYLKKIDELVQLDHKSLPFSYLVLARSRRSIEEILPALRPALGAAPGSAASRHERLVSPAHFEGQDQEFFICGQEGKRRARHRTGKRQDPSSVLERGDILQGPEVRGDRNSARIEGIKKIL